MVIIAVFNCPGWSVGHPALSRDPVDPPPCWSSLELYGICGGVV